ncbi:MAG: hypothetical protein V8P98_02875 [Acutalibacteraceae bacterium]
MKRRINNIKNELAYFYKVIKNMDIKDNIKQSKINEHKTPLDEILYDQFSVGENMDKHLEEKTLLGWIELIENQKLYEAVKGLSIEDQIFISYIIKEGLTQRELSIMYGLTQQDISYKFNKLIHSINKILHTT